MKRFRSISTPPRRGASLSQATPSQFVRFPQQFAGTHLYSWVERGPWELSALPRTTHYPLPGLEPRLLDPEAGALTMRPPRLNKKLQNWHQNSPDPQLI